MERCCRKKEILCQTIISKEEEEDEEEEGISCRELESPEKTLNLAIIRTLRISKLVLLRIRNSNVFSLLACRGAPSYHREPLRKDTK